MSAIAADGGKTEAVPLDVTDADAVKAAVDGVVERHGRVDLIFNNAGVAAVGEIREMGIEHWNWMLDVNVRGVIHGVLAAYPHMIRQRSGHIVNTASFAGLAPTPMMGAYATSKHAVVGLSRTLRAEARAFGVDVSVICPGIIQTPMIEANRMVGVDREKLHEKMPMTPVDVDKAAADILHGVHKKRLVIVITGVGRLRLSARADLAGDRRLVRGARDQEHAEPARRHSGR